MSSEKMNGEKLAKLLRPHLIDGGRLDLAEELCQEALEESPRSAEIWRLAGIVAMRRERFEDAVKRFEETVRIAPSSAAAHSALASGLLRCGFSSRRRARRELERALELEPRREMDTDSLVVIMLKAGELAPARELLKRAMGLGLICPRACAFMASAELDEGNAQEAAKLFIIAANHSQSVFTAIEACCLSLMKKSAFETARLALDPLAKAFPERPELKVNLAVCQMQAGLFQECFDSLDAASTLEPNSLPLLVNRGVALYKVGRFDDSIEVLRKALAIAPKDVYAELAIGLSLLKAGRLKEGWPYWEARLRQPDMANVSKCKLPLWTPEAPATAKVLVRCEQGFGDSVLFSRFLPLLRARCAHVSFICRKELLPLFAGFAGIDELVPLGSIDETDAHGCDFRIPLASLPRHFVESLDGIPKPDLPCFKVDASKLAFWKSFVAERLPKGAKLKAGLCWSGSIANVPGRKRSIPASELAPLLALPGVAWFSLQADAAEKELAASPLIPTSESLKDFSDTAALIESLDLVVSVDTATAHLAGALLKPVLVALCTESDWRWFVERKDSPWHPSAELFRQTRFCVWSDVIERIAANVAARV